MQKVLGMLLLLAGASVFALGGPASVPEIDPGSAGSALALLSGGLLVLRSRRGR